MARDNKQLDLQPADPFNQTDPKLNQVVPLQTFPENFMQIGPAVLVMLLTKKQRKKETKKSLDYNTPFPYRRRGNYIAKMQNNQQVKK